MTVWSGVVPGLDQVREEDAASKVTLLIPTKNHSDLLLRLLKYYRDLNFQGCICIGDSSDDAFHIECTKRALDELQHKLHIIYREYPGLNITHCMTSLVHQAPTRYAAAVMDDDFLVPSGLQRCVLFLEANPEYVAAHGVAALFSVSSGAAYGQIESVGYYRQPVIEGKSASQRLTDHLGNFAGIMFSVHRVESWRAMYKDATLVPDRWVSEELLPSCLSVIQGKVKELDCLYLMRQVHAQRAFHVDTFDALTSPTWSPSYEVFRNRLSQELVERDGISMHQAREVVKRALWSYLARSLLADQARPSPHFRWREGARRIPALRWGWRQMRSFLPGKEHRVSLPALLRTSSHYHADFMPVYRAVTTPVSGLADS